MNAFARSLLGRVAPPVVDAGISGPHVVSRRTGTSSHAVAIGRLGEEFATRFLERRGCTIVDRNARIGPDEIDLIVVDHGTSVAVEVKCATNGDDPLDTVDDRKLSRIRRATVSGDRSFARIDIVAVALAGDGADVRWLVDVR